MMPNLIESIRVRIPDRKLLYTGKAKDFFDILDNTQGLTEEFLYSHQPTTRNTVPVYSTSDVAIGSLDKKNLPDSFNLVDGPAIVVARKGYAGRLYVIEDAQFIVHEDAYPIRPKKDYEQHINLWWFASHYSAEFQADRTSFWGIGDFPRLRFRNKVVMLPSRDFQDKVAQLYRRRSSLIAQIESSKDYFYSSVDSVVKASLKSP